MIQNQLNQKEAAPVRRSDLLQIQVGDGLYFPKPKEDSAKAAASQLKRKGLARFKTKTDSNGILLTRIA